VANFVCSDELLSMTTGYQAYSRSDGRRPEDTDRNAGIAGMLRSGMSWTAIQAAASCSRATIAKVAKRAA
jgi:DNA invertase Pin-like site-specific DNA recombinase